MPPKRMKGKKKGEGKGKRKSSQLQPETDYKYYNSQIIELNRILSALRSRQEVIESTNEQLQKENQTLHSDETDIIQYLNRTISERNDEIAKIQKESDHVEAERTKLSEQFEDQKQTLMDNYRHVEEQLVSDAKLLVGKMHALEEFRVQRDELMNKYEIMENELEEQQIRHKHEIYDVERKFIIGKDKLKKEMDAKLKWLIEQFQAVTDIRVAATTLRVVKENIALNNKLDEMLQRLRKLYEKHEKLNQYDGKLKLLSQMTSYEATTVSSKAHSLQTNVVRLVNEYYDMSKYISKSRKYEPMLNKAMQEKCKKTEDIQQYKQMKRILQQNLHEYRCRREEISAETRYVNERNQDLIDMLLKAKELLESEAVNDDDVFTLVENAPESVGLDSESRSTKLYKLFDFLKCVREWNRTTGVIEKLECRDDIYMQGKLGLVPREVILKSMIPTKQAKGEQADGSYMDLLGEKHGSEGLEEEVEAEMEMYDSMEDSSVSLVEHETQTDEDTTTSSSGTLMSSSSSEEDRNKN